MSGLGLVTEDVCYERARSGHTMPPIHTASHQVRKRMGASVKKYEYNSCPEILVFIFTNLRRFVPYFYDTLADLF